MPIAARRAISSSSLLSLALPAAFFASLAQANLPEYSVSSLENQTQPALYRAPEPAPRDRREDAQQLEAAQQTSRYAAEHDTAAEPSEAIADRERIVTQRAVNEPGVQARRTRPGALFDQSQPAAANSAADHAAYLPFFIASAEPSTGGRQTSHDFKALGVPVLRSRPLGSVPVSRTAALKREQTPGSPGDHAEVADAGSGDRQWERNVDLKYVARSAAVREAGNSLAPKLQRYRLDRSAEHSRLCA
ncbi:hypothetical protein BVH03_24760 [Pseudomonas sp. PA15(2017)]|uniref:hypothetical protein n=1 Tax=Pseudomonas sp. PA15(2017) TaxID=1932111 RepID=UPI00095BB2B5|nr:hypothetical protein [Pseudomonas sp. PA15(2017)]OLU22443.1 hypothetical protein BVH03_24760 [Pseudomonas sp. PA15(2017)]